MEKIEQLLIPRWKIIADFPSSPFKVGEYLIIDSILRSEIYEYDNFKFNGIFIFPHEFPHLFKKLRWWEERENHELPKYIKFESRPNQWIVRKLPHPMEIVRGQKWPVIGQNHINFYDESGKIVIEEIRSLRKLSPATYEEYLQFEQEGYA